MGKKNRIKQGKEQELDIVKGSGKKFKKKGSDGAGKKVISVIAVILALVVVLGAFAWYYAPQFVKSTSKALESEHYKVTPAMLTYFFNNTYQNYVSSYQSYLSYIGLDVTKDLKDQTTTDGQTWYEYFLDAAKENATQLLVLCEAAYADKDFDTDDKEIDAAVDETMATIETQASENSVSVDYYLSAVYGSGVTEKTVRRCMELSQIASLYAQKLSDSYKFSSEDWDNYYSENEDTFRKVDYLKYTFEATATTVEDDATDEEKEAASAKDEAEAARLKEVAQELVSNASDETTFKAFVENYLYNDKYADYDEEALEADSIDIEALVDDCLTEGATYSQSDVNDWLFDSARQGYETYTEDTDTGATVYMIMPHDDSDIDSDVLYRDTYLLKNYRYIPVLIEDYTDDEGAKTAADEILAKYNEDATEDNFAALASEDQYGDGTYEGGLVEDGDKSLLSADVDEWLYADGRKEGDVEIIHTEDTGYYIVYFISDSEMNKWQSTADSSLKSDKYDEDYAEFEKEYTVTVKDNMCALVKEVDLSAAAETTAA